MGVAPANGLGRHRPLAGATLSRALALVCLASGLRAAEQAALPGFELATYTDGLDEPIAMEFAPDGRLFVAERTGAIRIVDNGVVQSEPLATIEIYYENENGLLGLALDPDFATNHFVYVFATISNEEQQIIRFTESAGLGGERTVIKDNLPTRGEFHSGGGLKFGPDGKLYFSIGDNLIQENAQSMITLAGKISRINADGSTPDDNPFRTPTGLPRAAIAIGLRNPFRFCFAPDGRMFALDVGSDNDGRREEINLIRFGGNYGWPWVEGRQSEPADPAYIDPIYDYHDGGAAPVGAVYYTGGAYPAQFDGNLFHLEYVLNRLYRVVLDGDRVVSHELFFQLQGGPVDLIQGPDGNLYYTEIHSGRIRVVRYVGNETTDGAVLGETVSADAEETSPSANLTVPACGASAGWAGLAALGLASTRRRTRLFR